MNGGKFLDGGDILHEQARFRSGGEGGLNLESLDFFYCVSAPAPDFH